MPNLPSLPNAELRRPLEMSTIIALTNSRTDEVKRPLSHQSTIKKIWVDLDNSPHVPFFRPIIEELKKRDYEVVVTARDAYQVRELVEFYGLAVKIAGKHYGKHKILKAFGTCWRALILAALMRREKPNLAICHGS